MEDIQKRIEEIEKEIRETPYHKATEHYIGKLRAKLAKLKDQVVERQGKKGGGSAGGFAVKQQGDATVVLVGFPSVGKSTLLNKLTNARSRVAPYEFTTVTVIPGMMEYKGARLQILDVPGLVAGAASGRGRGREVLSVIRGADILLLLAQVGSQEGEFERIEDELYKNGVRINKRAPGVSVKKTDRGGIEVRSSTKQDFDLGTVKEVAKEFGFSNAEVALQEKLSLDEVIDAFAKNRVYVPALYVVNKIDEVSKDGKVPKVSKGIPISAEIGIGLEVLKQTIWEKLELVRVYLRRPAGNTDYKAPIITRQGQTLSGVLLKIGSDFAQNKASAKIWGPGAKYPGQDVSLSAPVQDEIEVMFV